MTWRIGDVPFANELAAAIWVARMPSAYKGARIPSAEARRLLVERFANREQRFLDIAARAIYAIPTSPYRALLELAGCAPGDLQELVAREGVEGALGELLQRGVYLSYSEIKGHAAVRGSATVPIDLVHLRNPGLQRYVTLRRGEGKGRQMIVPLNVDSEREGGVNRQAIVAARGEDRWEHALWSVPGTSALLGPMRCILHRFRLARWFTQVDPSELGLHPRYTWAGRVLRVGAFVAGTPLPGPQFVSPAQPLPIAEWMAQVLRKGQTPHLFTYPSPAVRLCQAAFDAGIDLHGAQLSLGAEPMTLARRAIIERAGVTVTTSYSASETGNLGRGCLTPLAPDDTHFFHDAHAVIQPGAAGEPLGLPPAALLLTSLQPNARFILLNASLGDQADLSTRDCGCPLGTLGWRTHLHTIRSFEKLTAGGMTFSDSAIIQVLEEVLPQRFGGGPLDYQIVDDQAPDGSALVRLLVDPSVGPLDESLVRETFLEAIGSGDGVERVMAAAWRNAKVVRVERRAPRATLTGKVQHVVRATSSEG